MEQSAFAVDLKDYLRNGKRWNSLLPFQREALDLIATKISRILTGDPFAPDHWDDIAGYAHLGKGGHMANGPKPNAIPRGIVFSMPPAQLDDEIPF